MARPSPDVVIIDGQELEPSSSAELRLLVGGVADVDPKVLAMVTQMDHAARSWQSAGSWGVLDDRASPQRIVAAARRISAGYRLVVPDCEGETGEPRAEEPVDVEPAGLSELDLEAIGTTRRERDVLELIIRGYSSAEISEALFLYESTVKSHVRRMLDKFALRNRVHG